MTARRPSLLFYCQHSLGMGHLVRSLALSAELASRFRVVFLNGGRFPRGVEVPEGVEVVALPPLGFDASGRLVSRDRRRTLARAQQTRRRLLLDTFRTTRPDAVIVELFPFGRKKFADELVPLLDAATEDGPRRAVVVCSLRDILVGRADQQKHDERAVGLANRYFDAVLVHSDPRFARLEESLRSRTPLRVPVHHTGFVTPGARTPGAHTPDRAGERAPGAAASAERRRQVVVSAGGGLVGEHLLRTAVEAHTLAWPVDGIRTKIVAGPFLPEPAWRSLKDAADGVDGLTLRRYVRDLAAEMRASSASVSQCGYNTALDIVRAGTPALVVPFGDGDENEQSRRAERLARLGAVRVLDARDVCGPRLAEEIRELRGFAPNALGLDLDGARNTAEIVERLVARRRTP